MNPKNSDFLRRKVNQSEYRRLPDEDKQTVPARFDQSVENQKLNDSELKEQVKHKIQEESLLFVDRMFLSKVPSTLPIATYVKQIFKELGL